MVAYLQLGYHADVTASEEYDAPDRNAERVLTRAVHDATEDVAGEYAWGERELAVAAVRSALRPRLDALRSSRVESGTVYQVAYNQSAADEWQAANCPHGPNRQFGPCEADRGVVVQERANRTHVLAVAFDVRVTTDDSEMRLTVVVRAIGRSSIEEGEIGGPVSTWSGMSSGVRSSNYIENMEAKYSAFSIEELMTLKLPDSNE